MDTMLIWNVVGMLQLVCLQTDLPYPATEFCGIPFLLDEA